MDPYVTEEEQLEMIKNWFKKWGGPIIFAIILGLSINYGYRSWRAYKTKRAEQAAFIYQDLLSNQSNEDVKGMKESAHEIIKRFPKTPYAVMARFSLVRNAVESKQYLVAEQYLKWIIENAKSNPMKQIARNRMARILLAQNKPQQAIKILNTIDDKTYKAAIEEISGDAYIALHKNKQAREAYEVALQALPQKGLERPILQMKFHQLPESFSHSKQAERIRA